MGRTPSRSSEGQKREAWTAQEDKILASYIRAHGQGKWENIPKQTGRDMKMVLTDDTVN